MNGEHQGPAEAPVQCTGCDALRPPDAPMGLCPRCLIGLGLELTEDPDDVDEIGTGGLTLLEEVGRGGMAVVRRGLDADLRRVVAVKLLHDRHQDKPELVERFLDEARITGSLQHPGVVPVYGLGALPDGRRYFVMKLVEGRTLAAILAEDSETGPNRLWLLPMLLQIAHTIAYAHAHGVVHGDLTPSNVMLGEFGEVQVMDWGLARMTSDEQASALGVMGTPGYLEPERAAGLTDRPAPQSDVFALGSILCEILTGSPAYGSPTTPRRHGRSPAPDLSESLAKLSTRGADPELTALAEDCLAADPARRPADAGVVASRLSAYLDGVAQRLKAAELSRVAAETSAREQTRRRRLREGAILLAVALAGLAGFVVVERVKRLEYRRAAATLVLRDAEILRDQAAADPSGDPARWRLAFQALEQATPLLADAPAEMRLRLSSEAKSARQRLDAAVLDRSLLDDLEKIRHLVDEGEPDLADSRFETVFRGRGIDVLAESPAAVGMAVRGRPRDVADSLIAALDDWAMVRLQLAKVGLGSTEAAKQPLEAARAADADPWRNRLRDGMWAGDRPALVELARSAGVTSLPPPSLWLMGRLLRWSGQIEEADAFLLAAWNAHPQDFWINYELALVLTFNPPRIEEALVHASAAVALRPESAVAHLQLARVRACFLQKVDCEPEFRRAIRLAPDYFPARNRFAIQLWGWGRVAEAAEQFREAIRLLPQDRPFHPGITLANADPGYSEDHSSFPWVARLECLRKLSRLDEAENELAEALRRFPKSLQVWLQAARLRMAQLDVDRAAEALDRAEALLSPDSHTQVSATQVLARERVRLGLLRRFPAIRAGTDQTKDDAERLELAYLCGEAGWSAFASGLFAQAIAADQNIPEGRPSEPRRSGVMAAAMAGLGRSRDQPEIDAAEKTRLRAQALTWLRAELTVFTPAIKQGGRSIERQNALHALRGWLNAHELAGFREPNLRNLPTDEQAPWRTLWSDIQALLPRDTD